MDDQIHHFNWRIDIPNRSTNLESCLKKFIVQLDYYALLAFSIVLFPGPLLRTES
jgi:hypothetical protein